MRITSKFSHFGKYLWLITQTEVMSWAAVKSIVIRNMAIFSSSSLLPDVSVIF